jgi:hypothetical protein
MDYQQIGKPRRGDMCILTLSHSHIAPMELGLVGGELFYKYGTPTEFMNPKLVALVKHA